VKLFTQQGCLAAQHGEKGVTQSKDSYMRKTLLLFTILSAFLTAAQDNGENELGSWHMYFGTNRIADKWSIHTEGQLRYFEQA